MKNTEKTMDKIVALCKNRGFVYPGSEIYGGLANSWDYGPLGVEFKNRVERAGWQQWVHVGGVAGGGVAGLKSSCRKTPTPSGSTPLSS